MNWKLRIDSFQILNEEDVSLFAPPAEVLRAANSYNEALRYFSSGQDKKAAAMIRQISEDYPLFAQAGHLNAVLTAAHGETEKAEDLLRKVRLLEISEEEARRIDEELAVLKAANHKLQLERERQRRSEELLLPIKLEVAPKAILRRAPDDPRERLTFFRKKRPPQDAARDHDYPLNEGSEKRKTWQFAIVISVLLFFFLLFYFLVIQPGIVEEQRIAIDRQSRLDWLEEEIAERSVKDPSAADILKNYQDWMKAGKPERPDPETPASDKNPQAEEGGGEELPSGEAGEAGQVESVTLPTPDAP